MSGDEFLDRLLDIVSAHERIMVVGQVDTGKSTLIKNLADHVDTLVLDTDIGQNDIGPPSVISLGKRVDGQYRAIDGYFCGSTTPSRHFMPMIAGVSRLLPLCRKEKVLINTTGLATGAIGRALKTEKINAARPDLIIGLATGNELKYLHAFARSGSEVVTFRPHPHVTSRSRAQRAELRALSFRTHFSGAVIRAYQIDEIGFERLLLNNGTRMDLTGLREIDGTIVRVETTGDEGLVISTGILSAPGKIAEYLDVHTLYSLRTSDFAGALAGLPGSGGQLRGLGIIDSIDFRRGTISVFSNVEEFGVMQFGSMRLDKDTFSYAGAFGPAVLHPA